MVLKHAFAVVLFSVACPALAAFWTARQPKVYEASTIVYFDLTPPRPLGKAVEGYDPYGDYISRQERMETEFRVITSMRLGRQVVTDAGLLLDRDFVKAVFPGAAPESVTVDRLATYITSRTKVEPVRGTSLAQVRFEDNDALRAQRLVSLIVETYIRVTSEETMGSSGAALQWLNEQLGRLQGDLEGSEMALHNFKLQRNLVSVSLNDQSNMLRAEIAAFNGAVTEGNIRRAKLLARATALAKVTQSNPDDLPASELLSDTVLQALRTQYMSARADLAALTATGKGSLHPDVVVAQGKLDRAVEAFVKQVRNIQSAAMREAAVATSETASLKGLLEAARQRALELNLQEIEYNRLQRASSSNEKLYQNILERMKEVDVSRMVSAKTARVLDPPLLPSAPIRPRPEVNIVVGFAIGLVLGLSFAVFREMSNRSLETPADIESKLGMTSLGILPDVVTAEKTPRRRRQPTTGGAPELLVHDAPMSPMAEAARSIRSNLLFMSPDDPPKVILVTSAGPGEGKTTTATALAITFAQSGARTLLIDLDLRRPRVHRVFGLGTDAGVSTVLLGGSIEEAAIDTRIPNLSVMPAGPIPPNPAELLVSAKMSALIGKLRDRYDRVIIDSAPVNPITDTVILSTRVDGTIVVTRAFETTLEQIRHAARSLLNVKAHLLGVVLNAVNFEKAGYKYSQYYRYYGSYTSRREAGAGESLG